MSEEESTFFESMCYSCCWYVAKIYTYIQNCFCWFCKTKDDTINETTSIIKNIKIDKYSINNCKYSFLVIEIKANNKIYLLKDYTEFMYDENDFLTPRFVYNYLVSKKGINHSESDNESDLDNMPDYTINIIDNKSNFITLDNNSYLLLKEDNYEKIVLHDE